VPIVALSHSVIRFRWILPVVLMLACAGNAAAAIAEATRQARDWLVTRQRTDGAIVDASNPLFETWESLIAARALAGSRDKDHRAALQRSREFLLSQENADGLLCHNRRCREATCVETSAEYLQLLIDLGQRPQAAERWPALAAHRQPDGRFLVGNPDVRERPDYVSVTAFVLALGERLHIDDGQLEHSRAWMLAQQTAAGDFGSAWEYYGTPAYALWPVARALRARHEPVRAARRHILAWAGAIRQDDGGWTLASADSARRVSSALDTALMLLALKESGADPDSVMRAQTALIRLQLPDGHWDGGWFPIPSADYEKREDVFATAIAILALQSRAEKP
jgi:hypothetical protein